MSSDVRNFIFSLLKYSGDTSDVVGLHPILLGHDFDYRVLRGESAGDSKLSEVAGLCRRGVHPVD